MAKKKLTADQVADIQQRFREDPELYSQRFLAAEYRVGKTTIQTVIYGTYELAKKYKVLTDEEKAHVILNPDGLTQAALAAELGVSATHIGKIQSGKVRTKKQIIRDENIFSWIGNPAF